MEQCLAHVLEQKRTVELHVKLLIGVALFEVTVTKALQTITGRGIPNFLSLGRTPMVSSAQNSELLLLHGVLALNGLDTSASCGWLVLDAAVPDHR